MHVLILHNPRAARGRVSKTSLIRAFELAGHRVRYRSIREPGWKRALGTTEGAVVAAGGDGAIEAIAIALAQRRGSDVPLALIPAGTANNIAHALHVPASLAQLAAGLEDAERSRLAIGVLHAPWGETRFVESAGIGPMAPLMTAGTTTRRSSIAYLRRALLAQRPRRLTIRADGRTLRSDYVMVQVLNIGAVGPRLELARDADPTDDALDVLLVTPEQRGPFAAYLAAVAAGRRVRCPIDTIRARRIAIDAWPARDGGQVDDAPWPEARRPRLGMVRIRVETRIPVLISSA